MHNFLYDEFHRKYIVLKVFAPCNLSACPYHRLQCFSFTPTFRLERKGYQIWRHGHCHWLEFGRHRHWGPPDWSCRRLSFAASPWIWRWRGEKEHEHEHEHENENEDEDGWGLRTLAWDTTAFRDEERNKFPALVSPQWPCQSFPLWIGQKRWKLLLRFLFLLFLFLFGD